MSKGWEILERKKELCMLVKFSEKGGQLATIYRRVLLIFLQIFILLPLLNPVLDIIVPQNETRPRQQIFKVDYAFMDATKHFYVTHFHLSLITILMVFAIITIDSLYIIIIHHACGLFAVCGYQVEQATENHSLKANRQNTSDEGFEDFKECVMMHHEALLFYDTLDRCCRNLYLIQIGLNMIVISLTAVEVVMYLHKPDELIRVAVFLIGQKFHLFAISLPGQVLLDQSTELGDKIYASKWYQMPAKVQKLLYTMQMRCSRPCILTAGGLYIMKIECFGATVKACTSYMTMFLSLME